MFKKLIITSVLASSFLAASNASAASYTVQPKDTLWKVSQTSKVSVATLKSLNKLTTDRLIAGQVLQLTKPAVSSQRTHVLKKGDTLNLIAKQYKVTLSSILEVNPSITKPNLVPLGYAVILPSSAGVSSSDSLQVNEQKDTKQTLPAGLTVHYAASGDYLSVLSKTYQIDFSVLTAFNPHLPSKTALKKGDRVFFPNEELIILSKIIYLEAGGESLKGKTAVGNVIMNRIKDSRFPDTVKGVVYQKNQFSPVAKGKLEPTIPTSQTAQAAIDAYNGVNYVPEALFFFSKTKSTNAYVNGRKVVAHIENHTFAK